MKALSRVLLVKILLTIVIWCIPLLFFPAAWLQILGFPVPEPQIFLRLLGMAYTALVVGYCFGLRDAMRNRYPHAVVWVGVISNGGAFVLLLVAAISSTWAGWGTIAQWIMWCSLVGTGAISSSLVFYGLLATCSPIRQD
ncbi:MAG: hypothetical protein ABI644_05925 [Arenimonas sp.]